MTCPNDWEVRSAERIAITQAGSVMQLFRSPRPRPEANVVAAITQRGSTPNLITAVIAAGPVDSPIMMNNDVARLHVKMDDVVVIHVPFDIRQRFTLSPRQWRLRDEYIRLI